MFGLSASEIIMILVLALVVLGPQKLPEMARQLARFLGELRRVSDDMRSQFDEATREPPPPVASLPAANPSTQTDQASHVNPPRPEHPPPGPPKIASDPDTVAVNAPAPPPSVVSPVSDAKPEEDSHG